ncbi:MAG: RNA polymerase sigma factor [Phycisphaerae bacterium]
MALAAGYEPDEPVIEAIRRRDENALSELMHRHGRWVRGVIFGVLGDVDRVDDVAQQVWTTVWCRAGELRDGRRWRAWLYRLTHNAALDAGRETGRRRTHAGALRRVRTGEPGSAPVGQVAGDEQHQYVMSAIQALPPLYREPFVLRHMQGWTYRQIAEVMGVRPSSVETRLVRARRLLREALKDKMG